MSARRPKVLNVGQCAFDHGNISRVLSEEFNAEVEGVAGSDEAFAAVKGGGFDLVLVNRVFDADGASGLELIKRLQADDDTRATPVMLVSNYEDAQSAAVASGAGRGFGKDALTSESTRELLANVLGIGKGE